MTNDGKNHTPGPWEIQERDDRERGIAVIATIPEVPEGATPTRGMVAWIGQGGANFGNPQLQRANAHLIAAAPDMYESLKHAIGILESMDVDALGESGTSEDSWPLRDEYLHYFRAAIAKAEGRK